MAPVLRKLWSPGGEGLRSREVSGGGVEGGVLEGSRGAGGSSVRFPRITRS